MCDAVIFAVDQYPERTVIRNSDPNHLVRWKKYAEENALINGNPTVELWGTYLEARDYANTLRLDI